jgi:SAM-dependent methyltransferase
MITDLAATARVADGSRVLEIGAGTGQLTRDLALLGAWIVALELGAGLARVAARRLASHANVTVVNAAFETWPLPSAPFDLVVAATSFHWLDPAIRVARAADALAPGGTFAIVATEHVAGGTSDFFAAAQACYERWDPATPPGLTLSDAASIPDDREEVVRSGRFDAVAVRRYTRDLTTTTAEYLDLLQTYSPTIALEPEQRRGLLECIGDLIDTRHGGRVTKRYLTTLVTGHRVP